VQREDVPPAYKPATAPPRRIEAKIASGKGISMIDKLCMRRIQTKIYRLIKVAARKRVQRMMRYKSRIQFR